MLSLDDLNKPHIQNEFDWFGHDFCWHNNPHYKVAHHVNNIDDLYIVFSFNNRHYVNYYGGLTHKKTCFLKEHPIIKQLNQCQDKIKFLMSAVSQRHYPNTYSYDFCVFQFYYELKLLSVKKFQFGVNAGEKKEMADPKLMQTAKGINIAESAIDSDRILTEDEFHMRFLFYIREHYIIAYDMRNKNEIFVYFNTPKSSHVIREIHPGQPLRDIYDNPIFTSLMDNRSLKNYDKELADDAFHKTYNDIIDYKIAIFAFYNETRQDPKKENEMQVNGKVIKQDKQSVRNEFAALDRDLIELIKLFDDNGSFKNSKYDQFILYYAVDQELVMPIDMAVYLSGAAIEWKLTPIGMRLKSEIQELEKINNVNTLGKEELKTVFICIR